MTGMVVVVIVVVIGMVIVVVLVMVVVMVVVMGIRIATSRPFYNSTNPSDDRLIDYINVSLLKPFATWPKR
jgi:hypothetical protein